MVAAAATNARGTTVIRTEPTTATAMITSVETDVWYRKLGHPNDAVTQAAKGIKELGIDYKDSLPPGEVCIVSKSTQQAHPKTADHEVTASLEMCEQTSLAR